MARLCRELGRDKRMKVLTRAGGSVPPAMDSQSMPAAFDCTSCVRCFVAPAPATHAAVAVICFRKSIVGGCSRRGCSARFSSTSGAVHRAACMREAAHHHRGQLLGVRRRDIGGRRTQFQRDGQTRKALNNMKHVDPVNSGDRLDSKAAECPPEKFVRPPGHGPRAQTTPYMNRLRAERHAADMQPCKETGKPSKPTQ